MIEKVLLDYLNNNLPGIRAYMERPKNAPAKYVLIEKTGSGKEDHICSATFAFKSYADTLFEAASLNETVKEIVENSIELDEITRVRLNSDYNYTDTTEKKYRYQAVFDIKHY